MAGVRGLAAACFLAVALAAVPTAEAYRVAGSRWPGTTITYTSKAPRYDAEIARAARAWTRAKVGVRFKRVEATRARVVFRYASGSGGGPTRCAGVAGGAPTGYPGVLMGTATVFVLRSCRSPDLRALTAAHELGHVIGLGHDDRRCALMNTIADYDIGLGNRCSGASERRAVDMRRRLVLSDDRRGAAAMYRRPFARNDALAAFNPGGGTTMPYRPRAISFAPATVNLLLDYRWDFGDPGSGAANRASGVGPSHSFSRPGVYSITLTVRDSGAVVARQTQQLALTCFLC
jgi:hypothetical protein